MYIVFTLILYFTCDCNAGSSESMFRALNTSDYGTAETAGVGLKTDLESGK